MLCSGLLKSIRIQKHILRKLSRKRTCKEVMMEVNGESDQLVDTSYYLVRKYFVISYYLVRKYFKDIYFTVLINYDKL